MHLIDRLVTHDERSWLRERFDAIALSTHSLDGEEQAHGRVRYRFITWSPVTMGLVTVRVVLESDHVEIMNAFPARRIGRTR